MARRWIYLLRHGIAEDLRPDISDDERALTDEGWRRLRRAGEAWGRLVESLDVVLTSPLQRARETTTALLEAVDCGSEPRVEEALVPHGAPVVATALLEAELLQGTGRVAVVGHEPHLGYLLGALLTGHPRLSVPLKKGMMVALQCESTTNLLCGLRWSLTHKAAAQL